MSTTDRPRDFNRFGKGHLPELIGLEIVAVTREEVHSRLALRPELMAPNGFLHGATVVALADTSCGYGCVATLPEGARGFTTIELKTSFLGTAREGTIECRAKPLHLGRTTQVCLNPPVMTRRFFGFYFYFHCLLADWTG